MHHSRPVVWYQCSWCKRFLETLKNLKLHKKKQHPKEYAEAKEEKKQKLFASEPKEAEKWFVQQIPKLANKKSNHVVIQHEQRHHHQSVSAAASAKEERASVPVVSTNPKKVIPVENDKWRKHNKVFQESKIIMETSSESSKVRHQQLKKRALSAWRIQEYLNRDDSEEESGSKFSKNFEKSNQNFESNTDSSTKTNNRASAEAKMSKNDTRFHCRFCHKYFSNSNRLQSHLNRRHGDRNRESSRFSQNFDAASPSLSSPPIAKNNSESNRRLRPKNDNEGVYHRHDPLSHFDSNSKLKRESKESAVLKIKNCFKKLEKDEQDSSPYDSDASTVMLRMNSRKMSNKNETGNSKNCQSNSKNWGHHGVECGICKKILSSQRSLEVHNRIHTRETPYMCHICCKEFMWNTSLHRHMAKVHPTKRSSWGYRPATTKHQNGPRRFHSRNDASGNFVGVKTSSPPPSNLHVNNVPSKILRVDQNEETVLIQKQFSHQLLDGQDIFVCKICFNILPDSIQALNHTKTHHSHHWKEVALSKQKKQENFQIFESPWRPRQQEYSYQKSDWSKKIFRCHVCKKYFFDSLTRTVHLLRVHRRWTFCSKKIIVEKFQFEDEQLPISSFIEWKKAELPTKAKITTWSSDSRVSLPEKIDQFRNCLTSPKTIQVEGPLFEKIANVQSQSYKSCVYVTQHGSPGERSLYSCNFCGKIFQRSHHAVVHTRIHTGETPYGCPLCDKKFGDPSNLSAHRKRHETEMLFQ